MMKTLLNCIALTFVVLFAQAPSKASNAADPSCPLTITSPSTVLTCSQPVVTLNAITSAPSPTYLWSNGATTATINATAYGMYSVTMTSGSCSSKDSVFVTGSGDAPTVNITSPTTRLSCATSSIRLTAFTLSPNPTYKWSTGETTRQIYVMTAGTYTVTITSGGCTATFTKVITGSNEPVTVSISGATEISCAQQSVTLTASSTAPGATYEWSNMVKGPSVTAVAGGTYSVTMYSGNCTAQAAKVVTVNTDGPAVTISGDTALSCTRQSVALTASTAAASPTYLWSTGATTPTINVTTADLYSVTMTSGTCVTTVFKWVTGSPAAPSVTVTSPTTVLSCTTTQIRLTAATASPNPTYLWSTGETTRQIYVTTAGSYSVTITSEGCTATFTKIIKGGCSNTRLAASEEAEIGNLAFTLSIYPNPAHEKLQAEISSNGADPVQLRMLNTKGQVVVKKDLTPFSGKQMVNIPVDRFSNGLYFLEVVSGTEKVYKRVLID